MKKLIAGICLSFIVLIQCSEKGNIKATVEKDITKKITIWESYNDAEHAAFIKIVSNFTRKNNIEIELMRIPFGDTKKKISMAFLSGTEPDIFRIATTETSFFAEANLLYPLDNFQGASEMFDNMIPIGYEANKFYLNKKEKIYGMADQLICLALFYNKDMFKKAGIKNPPETLDELYKIGKKLTNRKKGIYGLGINNSLWWHSPWLYLHGATIMNRDNSETYVNSKEMISGFNFLLKLVDEKSGIEGGAWRAGGIEPDEGFINGKYAMILSGTWNLNTFSNMNYGVALIPGKGNMRSATNIGGTTLAISRFSKNKDAAFKFLKYLSSYEAQKIWVDMTGQNSINKNIAKDYMENFPQSPISVFYQQLKYSRGVPKVMNYAALEGSLNPFSYAILDRKMAPEEALKMAKKFIEKHVIEVIQKERKRGLENNRR